MAQIVFDQATLTSPSPGVLLITHVQRLDDGTDDGVKLGGNDWVPMNIVQNRRDPSRRGGACTRWRCSRRRRASS